MIEFIKGLFNGSRFVNSKYLDNQFDCFIDYVDVTEEDLQEEILRLDDRIDELEEMFDSVLVKTTGLMESLNQKLTETSKKAKKPVKANTAKVSKKVKAKK